MDRGDLESGDRLLQDQPWLRPLDINAKHGRQVRGVNPEVLEMFAGYSWPGNVRELRNVLERAAIVTDRDLIGRAHLPADFGHAPAATASDLA